MVILVQRSSVMRSIVKRVVPSNVRRLAGSLRQSQRAQHAYAWDANPSDVFLVSYPRSGNTWLRNVLTNLRFPDAEWDLYSLSVAFPERGSNIDPRTAPQPRWIKSHSGYDASYPKVAYLLRDGRDVAVSFYHWSGAAQGQMPFEHFVRTQILHPQDGRLSWHQHVKGWASAESNRVQLFRYEDCLNKAPDELARLCEFFGIHRTRAEIEVAVNKSTYEKQQKDFDNHEVLKGKKVGVGVGAGSWKEYFDGRLLDDYWEVAGEAMMLSGYEK